MNFLKNFVRFHFPRRRILPGMNIVSPTGKHYPYILIAMLVRRDNL